MGRPRISDAPTLRVLTHPVRIDLLSYLMARGPATASACARAVGDTPSNCSYHLRLLAGRGLVERAPSEDGRERPWRATLSGFEVGAGPGVERGAEEPALIAAALDLDARLARQHLADRTGVDPEWRRGEALNRYVVTVTPEELERLVAAVDAVVRPWIAGVREDVPQEARPVQVGVTAFRRPEFDD